jgi:hypothetical protein
MASTAISAQGSKVEVNTATAGAKTITGITQANPAVFTSTAHGLSKGDVVTLAAIVGMTQLNGLTGVVTDFTANTFTLSGTGVRDTTGYTAYSSGGTATPVAWTQVANVRTFSGPDGSAAVLDATNLQSTGKEKRMGLFDEGNFSMEIDLDPSDAGQTALLTARSGATQKQIRVTLPSLNTFTFSGYVLKVSAAGGVDALVKRNVDIAITGAGVWA